MSIEDEDPETNSRGSRSYYFAFNKFAYVVIYCKLERVLMPKEAMFKEFRFPHGMALGYGYADIHSDWYVMFHGEFCDKEHCGEGLKFFRTPEEALEFGAKHGREKHDYMRNGMVI